MLLEPGCDTMLSGLKGIIIGFGHRNFLLLYILESHLLGAWSRASYTIATKSRNKKVKVIQGIKKKNLKQAKISHTTKLEIVLRL